MWRFDVIILAICSLAMMALGNMTTTTAPPPVTTTTTRTVPVQVTKELPLLLAKLIPTLAAAPVNDDSNGDDEKISLRGSRLRAVTILEDPYVMRKVSDAGETYSGFVIDILKELAGTLGFSYDLYLVPDGTYGAPKGNNTWSGLIGQVIQKQADVAVAPVTISSTREQVVDFTNPFMDLGAGLLIRKPEPEGTSLFAFLLPFNSRVWLSILGALFGTAILLYVTSRIRYRCNVGDQSYDNDAKFNFKNSLWLTYWSIVRKGGEPAPRSLPSRILAGAWWFFTLIVISTYTANLTAFLTVKRLVAPIKSIDDLAGQSAIPYSVTYGTFLYSFFESQVGTGSVYERMWYTMKANNRFPGSSMAGVDMVRNEEFVLIEETPFLEYAVRTDKNCGLMLLGKPFLFKGYGFATGRGSPLKKPLSVGILKLQESGRMSELRDRWWPKDGCPLDGQSSNVKSASALGLDIFLGVFYLLAGAAVMAIIITAVQVIYTRYCKGEDKMQSLKERRASFINNRQRRESINPNLH
ncbi:glutamate receptor ionotropic, kainate 1-like [Branchiostoma floridae x Branchiostoma japonicum]